MSDPATVPHLDDRAPYPAARAIAATLVQLCDRFESEDDVFQDLVEGLDEDSEQYLRIITRAQHSVFYHQLQEFYEYGRRTVPPEASEGFCVTCGRTFMAPAFVESLYPVLQMALAGPGEFQPRVVEMMQSLLYHYAGEKYIVTSEIDEHEIRVTLAYRHPELFHQYLQPYGLDPARCFRNSFEFISGAIQAFAERIVADYDGAGFRLELQGETGTVRVPVRAGDRFAYETLIPTLLGFIGDLRSREEEASADKELESGLIIESPLMREKWHRIRRASRSDEIVLLRGESGTGKSFIARKIHDHSMRSDRPFIEVGLTADIGSDNLIQSDLFGHERGAFTGANEHKQGLFSLADGGTIFLDEIGDCSPELQAKLLRVVESSTFKRLGGVRDISVDVRVIAATNRDLERMVEQGTFRRDLYYRLNVIPILMPTLRERREEIPALAEFLLARAQARSKGTPRTLAPGLTERMRGYDWPGNIRELDHALKHAAAMAEGDVITESDLPEAVSAGLSIAARTPEPVPPRSRSDVIDVEGLRRAIRSTPPMQAAGAPAHIDHAKRTWLATLIEECGGDLGLIAQYWDRSSEKTLRALIRSYDLTELLAEARRRRSE
jgi:DNA-binding NtrC family response regulator